MVKINFKLNEVGTLSLQLEKEETLETVLQMCMKEGGFELGGYIAVRGGEVVRAADIVGIEDNIDIFPAISGG